jgi:hypothetical protein
VSRRFPHQVSQRRLVRRDFRDFVGGELGDFEQVFRGVARVHVVFPAAFVGDEPGRLELGKLGGNPALAHAEDLLKLGHRERFVLHQHEDSQAGGIGQKFQGFEH